MLHVVSYGRLISDDSSWRLANGGGPIALSGEVLSHLGIHGCVMRLHCCETIYVAVVHAKGSGNEHGVVDFEIRGPFSASGFD
jgi:hypothetical protein